ncbi:MAG: hypothetical protein LBE85_03235 [Candidatus Accumulibacter sp.]|jgi:hypothetical protein|nr:hypothetical protein [Accumulibacter sp.]
MGLSQGPEAIIRLSIHDEILHRVNEYSRGADKGLADDSADYRSGGIGVESDGFAWSCRRAKGASLERREFPVVAGPVPDTSQI